MTDPAGVTVPAGWDRHDLERRLSRSLDVAGRVVERLAPDGYHDPEDPSNSLRSEKVISETALLLFAAWAAHADGPLAGSIDEVARALIPHARSERMLLGMCLEPALAWDYAGAHVCLTRIGHPDHGVDEVLRLATTSQASAGRERTPNRVLERDWLRDRWAGAAPADAPSAAALSSSLNHPLDLYGGGREDVYAFTHALMYVSDFNVQPGSLPRSAAEVLAEAEAVLARFLDDQDYDIVGEVLLAWPLTSSQWTAAAAFGLRVLAAVEDAAGFLPTPATRLDRLGELTGDARTDYLLATSYHATYVMGLLCAGAQQPGREPPADLPVDGAIPGAAEALLPFLTDGTDQPHWLDEFGALSVLQQDALGGLLFMAAAHRHVRRRDFGGLLRLLETCHRLGLSDTPAASQAAELLGRLAVVAKLPGVSATLGA